MLLVTESDGPSKQWSVDAWKSLSDVGPRPGTRRATQSLATRSHPRSASSGIAHAHAPSPGDALDVLGAAAAVIGIDTGLTHLAVQQGTPTVTICRTPAVFFRPWPHARVVVGDRCDDACVADENAARVQRRGRPARVALAAADVRRRGHAASMRSNPKTSSAHWSTSCDHRGRRVPGESRPQLTASRHRARRRARRRVGVEQPRSQRRVRRRGLRAATRYSTSPCSRRTSRLSTTSTSMRSRGAERSASCVTLNHLGMLRAYLVGRPSGNRDPATRRSRVDTHVRADVERTVVLGDRIVGSRPREDGAPGLLVSERLSMPARAGPAGAGRAAGDDRDGHRARRDSRRHGRTASRVGSDGQVSLVPATANGIGRPRWTVDVDFEPRVVLWDGALVWAAGCDRVAQAIDDYDWEALGGGGFAATRPDRRPRRRARSLLGGPGLGQRWRRSGARARRTVRHRTPG